VGGPSGQVSRSFRLREHGLHTTNAVVRLVSHSTTTDGVRGPVQVRKMETCETSGKPCVPITASNTKSDPTRARVIP
jgi:hypothetical protein